MKPKTIPDIILRGAERWPDKEAFRCNGNGIRYSELADKCIRLSRLLCATGVSRGDRVAVYVSKSENASLAIYGVMMAGAAYVPLDPKAPTARITAAARDAGVSVLVTERARLNQVEALTSGLGDSVSVIVLDGGSSDVAREAGGARFFGSDAIAAEGTVPPPVDRQPDDLAYVMYTSGSTGVPKGIMHTHASGLAYAEAAALLYGVNGDDRVGNHSPLHFDMSTFDYFAGPLAGATTVVIPEAYSVLPASMTQLAADEKLTIWYSVPLALVQMLTRGVMEERDLSALRWVLFGGEPFPPRHLQELMRRLPNARFSNVYGPAEVNQCTYYHVPAAFADADGTTAVPLGNTWSVADGVVVDDEGSEVGLGAEGELCVSTPTMMVGYWNRSDLDAEAFFLRDGRRFYRTGDVVRIRNSGLMEFVGRKDRQVKIRGYRVELDEVERALASHADVYEAAAVVTPSEDGINEILAAVRVAVGATARSVQMHVHKLLPAYAVPARIEVLESFPRTGSGKTNRVELTNLLSQNSDRKEVASGRV